MRIFSDRNRINISLLLISFSIFLYQVCLLRIISIADYYHFAFLIVSVALLGFGISGSFLYFFTSKIKNPGLIRLIFAFGFSITVFLSFVLINRIPFDSFRIMWEIKQVFYLLAYYFFLLLPFFFGGSFIGYVLQSNERPGVIYFYNLIGSALGAIAFIIIMKPIGKTGVIVSTAAMGVAATLIILNKKYLKQFLTLCLSFLIVVALLYQFYPAIFEIRMSPYKSLPSVLRNPGSKILISEENPYSLLDVISSESIRSAPGLSLKYNDVPPPQLGLTVDGDNISVITEVKKDAGRLKESDLIKRGGALEFLNYLPVSVVFESSPELKNILIIEPGGGLDVLASLYFSNHNNITVLQNNEMAVDLLKNEKIITDFNGNIYNRKNIKIYEMPGRNFIKQADDKYDLIIVSLSDSFHPVSSGAYSLNEDYLYTVESVSGLMNILAENGMISITRWIQFPPSEDLKVISTLVESAEKTGMDGISSKVFAFRSWSTLTVMFKNGRFTDGEINKLSNKIDALNFDAVYYAGVKSEETNKYNQLEKTYYFDYFKRVIESGKQERESFYRQYYFNIKPSTDNNPYFYNFFKFRQIPEIVRFFGKSTQPFGGGSYLVLISAMAISVILSLIFILFPLRLKKVGINFKRDFKFLGYFLVIGFGFFFIELPFIQKFILVLDKPAVSLAVILFSLMLSAGIGSYLSSRVNTRLELIISIIVVYIILFVTLSGFVIDFIIVKQLWQRAIYTVLIVFPLGFFMGMPFPKGIAAARQTRPEIIPWLWAVNGFASVIGSIAAVMISIHLGFLAVIVLSAVMYILALALYRYIKT
ncbi:MAG: spermidine synthase [Actinobacteria bacterium ADurb.Bin346]|nr:MAG: spermidine synthase [Actinobacteria bacterium ADurb.Bin346]